MLCVTVHIPLLFQGQGVRLGQGSEIPSLIQILGFFILELEKNEKIYESKIQIWGWTHIHILLSIYNQTGSFNLVNPKCFSLGDNKFEKEIISSPQKL